MADWAAYMRELVKQNDCRVLADVIYGLREGANEIKRLRVLNTEARDTLQAVLHRLPNNSKWQALAQRVEGAIAVLRP